MQPNFYKKYKMNITRENVDALNAVVTIAVTKEDYSDKVAKILANYKKSASIPGFRKGAVPMSVIQKQYGKAVLLDEVNKLLQSSLNDYLVQEKLDILGNPLPKITEDFSWEKDDFTFQFELGLAPQFNLDLASIANVVRYKIVADDNMLNEQLVRIQKQYGKLISKNEVEDGFEVSGTFLNEEYAIQNRTTFALDIFKDKKTAQEFIGKKVGDVVVLNTKDLFEDPHKLMDYLKVSHDVVHDLAVEVTFSIDEINSIEPAELNQDLFDKLFANKAITTIEELKAKIKEDAEDQFLIQSNQKFLNDVTESLIEHTKFELPAVFLKKWIQNSGEQPLTATEAEIEYEKSEKGLRYQLIEGKLIVENNLQTTFEDLKAFTAELIKKQMAQFGQLDPSDEEVDGIVARVLSNKDEIKRLSEQIMSKKMLELYIEKVPAKVKEVNYQEFIKYMYGE